MLFELSMQDFQARVEIPSGRNLIFLEVLLHAQARLFRLKNDRTIGPVPTLSLGVNKGDFLISAKKFEIPRIDPLSLIQNGFHVRKHRKPHGGMKLAVLSVDADACEPLRTIMTKIPQQAHLFSNRLIHKNASPFNSMKKFGCVKTTSGYVVKLKMLYP